MDHYELLSLEIAHKQGPDKVQEFIDEQRDFLENQFVAQVVWTRNDVKYAMETTEVDTEYLAEASEWLSDHLVDRAVEDGWYNLESLVRLWNQDQNQ